MTTPKMYAGQALEPGRVTALSVLHRDVAQHLDDGRHVPCCSIEADLWISDERADQEIAADRCLDCPVYLRCLRYVTDWPEPSGVWAASTANERSNQ